MDENQRHLTWALIASLLLHGLVMMIHFTPPRLLNKMQEKALDVILVNSRSKTPPEQAQAKAQTSLDGGGNTEEDVRAKTPLPASAKTKEGNDLIEAQKRVAALEEQQRKALTQLKSDTSISTEKNRNTPTPEQAKPVSGVDLATKAMAFARIEGQIARQVEEYNQRPRKKFIGARVEEYRFAQYVEDWRQKIERVGNLNYPESARGRLYGSLVITVVIKSSGELDRVEINRTSGKKVLDDAAVRIVQLAGSGGFAPFPEAIRRDTDVIEITRTWTFTNSDKLHAD